MKLTQISLKRPVSVLMFFMSLFVVGLLATKLLPLELLPTIKIPVVLIDIPYPGATPEQVEQSVTLPAEEAIATLSGITRIYSTSSPGNSNIRVVFSWDSDLKTKRIQAREKLEAIRDQLPDNVERITLKQPTTTDQPLLTVRISSNRNLANEYDLLDRQLKQKLERIKGVARVSLYGVSKKEIRILLKPERIQSYNIDIAQVIEILNEQNFNFTAGEITSDQTRLLVKPLGEYKEISDIESLMIDQQKQIRLIDIASVLHTEPPRIEGRHLNLTNAIGIDVYKEDSANLVEVERLVLDEIQKADNNPAFQGITLKMWQNQAENVRQSLDDLLQAGGIGALLSLIVLYLFLRRITTTLIVTLAVPFSLLATLACMYFLGISLNILSMMGLMLAVGMLVDNAVVITESIQVAQNNVAKQHSKVAINQATLNGVKEVGLAVTAGTFTTMIVFLPNIFGSGDQISIFLKHVAVPICISLFVSLLVAQSLIPSLLAYIHRSQSFKNQAQAQENGLVKFQRRYARLLRWSLNHPRSMSVLIIVIMASIVIPADRVKFDMYPQEENKTLVFDYSLDAVYPVDQVEESVNQMEAFIWENKERFHIDTVYSYFRDTYAVGVFTLYEDSPLRSSQVKELIMKELPKIPRFAPGFDYDSNSGEQTSISIIGDSTQGLLQLVDQVVDRLKQLPELVTVRNSDSDPTPEVVVTIDKDKINALNLRVTDISQVISTALRGQELRSFRTKSGETDILLEFDRSSINYVEDLYDLPIRLENGTNVPLESLATIAVKDALNVINRTDRLTSLNLFLGLAPGVTADEAQKAIERAMSTIEFPAGYRYRFGFGFQRAQDDQNNMVQNMLLAIVFIYLVMAALFESKLYPSAIMSTIAFSIVGVFWFFMLTNTVFSIMAMIGILILMGIVVNNGIVYIDRVIQLRATGMNRMDALVQSGQDRLRPILMTVLTTVVGLVPLSLGDVAIGGDGPAYYPMARAVIGGLLFSSVITLFALPVLYLGLDNLKCASAKIKLSVKEQSKIQLERLSSNGFGRLITKDKIVKSSIIQ